MIIKPVKALLLAIMILMGSCNNEPGHVAYANVLVSVSERVIPPTGLVNTPLSITAVSVAPNGCWYNINFIFRKVGEYKYELSAYADYESYGECPDVLVTADTVITFTPVTAGDYAVFTWVTESSFEIDTIRVIEPLR